jgi:2-C-methyl-D-erythritol 2,4-cyclodiphosphate synthase
MSFVGIGYDVHRLKVGRKLVLGGIEIPYERGLDGHSDADVLTHAIADALLGAAGEKDIGHHFPNTDPSLKGIDSQEILRRVQAILTAKRFAIVNIDCTLIAEAPKIGPHLQAMKAKLSQTLQIASRYIGVKATTNEGLGLIGQGEAIAAMAVVSLERVEPRFPAEPGGKASSPVSPRLRQASESQNAELATRNPDRQTPLTPQ